MKQNKTITVMLPLFLFFICSISFSQVKLPISGVYNAPIGADFDKLEIDGQKITSLKGATIVGTFFAIEQVNDIYVLEMARPGTESYDPNPKRDRKLMKVKVNLINDNECHLTVTWPNGTTEQLTLNK